MRRIPPILVAVLLISLPRAASAAPVLPKDAADDGVFMVDGPVVHDVVTHRSNVWIGGTFSQVQSQTGASVASATGLAVLTTDGGLSRPLHRDLPRLSGAKPRVFDLAVGGNGVVYVAGEFEYVHRGRTYRNLIGIDASDGSIAAAYRVPSLKSVLVAYRSVFAGGRKLWRFGRGGGPPAGSFHEMKAYLDSSLRGHENKSAFREIASTGDGNLIVAGQFDWIDGTAAANQKKVAVKVNAQTGRPDLGAGSWTVDCRCARQSSAAFGLAVDVADGIAYIGAGGNDFVAAVRVSNGSLIWQTDANGSVQDLAVYGASSVIVGGHWTYIEDDGPGDQSGSECPARNAASPHPCWEQRRLAAIARSSGMPFKAWTPRVCCRYRGIWATTTQGATVHVGGEFTTLDPDPGPERFYGRFST